MGEKVRDFLSHSIDFGPERKKRKDYSRITFNRARHEKVHGAPDKDGVKKILEQEHLPDRPKVVVNALLENVQKEIQEERRKKEARALAEASRSRKLLVIGDARGDFEKLFSMVGMQNSKVGPFDAVLCVGSFLPEAGSKVSEGSSIDYLQGKKQAPQECYFIDTGSVLLQAAPEGATLNENLHFLGAYGVREVCGLRVAFLSGHYDSDVYDTPDVDFVGGAFTKRALDELKRLVVEDPAKRGVDVLLTAGWPAGIDRNINDDAQKPPEVPNIQQWQLSCSDPLADLCFAIEPRYHIFGSADIFYQRPPFQTTQRRHTCRCIGLGQVGSPLSKQQKWVHALALSPMAYMKGDDLTKPAPGSTACPFTAESKEKIPEQQIAAATSASDNTEALEEAMSDLLNGDVQSYWKAAATLQKSPFVWTGADPASSSH